jgi:hypothetical protein
VKDRQNPPGANQQGGKQNPNSNHDQHKNIVIQSRSFQKRNSKTTSATIIGIEIWGTGRRLRRLAAGHFFLRPTSYSIYTLQSPEQRVTFDVSKPTAVWWNRL